MDILFIDEKQNSITKFKNAICTPRIGESICFDTKANENWGVLHVAHVMIQGAKHGAVITIKKIP